MDFSACPDDELFGPAVQGCRDDFDFTIRFEKIFFSLIPASVFTAGSLTRALYLYTRRPVLIRGNIFRYLKLVSEMDSTRKSSFVTAGLHTRRLLYLYTRR